MEYKYRTKTDQSQAVLSLQAMRAVEVPIYDFNTHSRSGKTQHVEPADVVIMEGILVLHIPEVRELFNMKIFVVSFESVDHQWDLKRHCNADNSLDLSSAFICLFLGSLYSGR